MLIRVIRLMFVPRAGRRAPYFPSDCLMIDDTHDPARRSWVDAANAPDGDFPIQNLPFCVFKRAGASESPRVGVAIGDQIVDVGAAANAGVLSATASIAAERCREPQLNALMELGHDAS